MCGIVTDKDIAIRAVGRGARRRRRLLRGAQPAGECLTALAGGRRVLVFASSLTPIHVSRGAGCALSAWILRFPLLALRPPLLPAQSSPAGAAASAEWHDRALALEFGEHPVDVAVADAGGGLTDVGDRELVDEQRVDEALDQLAL